jgi:hypothetical protein
MIPVPRCERIVTPGPASLSRCMTLSSLRLGALILGDWICSFSKAKMTRLLSSISVLSGQPALISVRPRRTRRVGRQPEIHIGQPDSGWAPQPRRNIYHDDTPTMTVRTQVPVSGYMSSSGSPFHWARGVALRLPMFAKEHRAGHAQPPGAQDSPSAGMSCACWCSTLTSLTSLTSDRPNHNCPALRNLEALAHGSCVNCENDSQVYTGHAPARDRRTDPRSAEARKSRDLQPLLPNSGSQPHPPTRRYRTSCCSAEAPACDTQRSAPFPCPIV